jgi:hypothetical protein
MAKKIVPQEQDLFDFSDNEKPSLDEVKAELDRELFAKDRSAQQCPECGEVPIWGPCPHGCVADDEQEVTDG